MSTKSHIAAIDVGSSIATLILGVAADASDDGGQGPKLSIVDISSRPLQGVTRGEVTNRQQASEAIKELISDAEQRLGIHIGDLYTSSAGRHIRSATHEQYILTGDDSASGPDTDNDRDVSGGRNTDGEIFSRDVETLQATMSSVQPEEGLRILERIPLHYLIDGRDRTKNPAGRFGKKLSATYNFVLGSQTLIDRLEKTLLSLGVRSRRTFTSAVASAAAVTLPEEKELGTAVIDLGAGTTDLCVWHDGAVAYVRSIPFGAGDLNRDIHQQGILEKHVEELKRAFGRALPSQVKADKLIAITGRSPRDKQEISQRNLAIIIEHRLREIAEFVVKEISESGLELDQLRGGIVLTGGGSKLIGIDELLRDATGLEVRLATPDIHVTAECAEQAKDPALATAIGLLLKALEDPSPARIDSTPSRVHRQSEQPDRFEKTDDDDFVDDSKGRRKPKPPKRPGRFKNWIEGFMSETLEGDEDL